MMNVERIVTASPVREVDETMGRPTTIYMYLQHLKHVYHPGGWRGTRHLDRRDSLRVDLIIPDARTVSCLVLQKLGPGPRQTSGPKT